MDPRGTVKRTTEIEEVMVIPTNLQEAILFMADLQPSATDPIPMDPQGDPMSTAATQDSTTVTANPREDTANPREDAATTPAGPQRSLNRTKTCLSQDHNSNTPRKQAPGGRVRSMMMTTIVMMRSTWTPRPSVLHRAIDNITRVPGRPWMLSSESESCFLRALTANSDAGDEDDVRNDSSSQHTRR